MGRRVARLQTIHGGRELYSQKAMGNFHEPGNRVERRAAERAERKRAARERKRRNDQGLN
jgi:hypothetical protein